MKALLLLLVLIIPVASAQVSFGFSQNSTNDTMSLTPAITIMQPTCPVAANNLTVIQFMCSGGITKYELYADGHLDRATDIDGMELGMTWYLWQTPVIPGSYNVTVIGYNAGNQTARDSIMVKVV